MTPRCPACNYDLTDVVKGAISDAASRAGLERVAGMTQKQRTALARKAGKANGKRSKKAKAETRRRQSEAMKAVWAAKRAR